MRKPFKLYRKDEIPIGFDVYYVEQEIINILSEEIAREIDREIITNLVSVQPISAPLRQLFYLDYVYTPPTPVTMNYRTRFKLKRKKP